MKMFGVLVLVGVLLTSTHSYGADEEKKDGTSVSALQGSYTLIAGEKDGQTIPSERIRGSTVRITENTMTIFDEDEKETYAVTYTIDKSQNPWKLTMTSTQAPVQGEVAYGLVEKDGDTVKLIYAVRGGAVPDDFTTEQNQLLFVMKQSG